MSSNKISLSLKKKRTSSSDSNDFKILFEENSNKDINKNNNDNEEDDDDMAKKFGSEHNSNINNKKEDEEENEDENEEDDGDLELDIDENDDNYYYKKDKSAEKEKSKKIKNYKKNYKINELSEEDDKEKMDIVYSSSEYEIEKKYYQKSKIKEKSKSKKGKNKGKKMKKKSIPPSRFKTDFTIIKKLGQGGEGAVFKVRNNWDKVLYAIKIIKTKINTKNEHDEITENLKKEVNFLSHYSKCPYIVRYYQTWMEDYNDEEFKDLFEDEDELCSTKKRKSSYDDTSRSAFNNRKTKERKFSYASADDENSSNTYEEEESEEENTKENNKNEGNHIWSESESDSDESSKPKKIVKLNNKKNQIKTKLIFIQMELCENNTLRYAIDENQLKSDDEKLRLISQILEGMEYIHNNKYIHRDLKPGNIFLDKENNVKIGDFGLAKNDDNKSKDSNNNINFFLNNYNDFQLMDSGGEIMTVGIGTQYYCSPEQKESNKYDFKTDIYSLGIIIFEMFYKFNSLMERDITLRKINVEEIYPSDMEEKCGKNVAILVKKCTNHNPKKRPTIEELLKSNLIPASVQAKKRILKEFNDQFLDKNIKLIDDFLQILIAKKKELTNTNIDENVNDEKIKSKKNENDALMIYDDNFSSSLFCPLQKILDLNPNQENINDSSIYTLSIYEKVHYQLQQILYNYNAFYYKMGEIESYAKKNEFIYYNSNENKMSKIYLNNISEECVATENGILLSKSKNMLLNLKKNISSIYNTRFFKTFIPITFYYDSSGLLFNSYNFGYYKEYNEYNDMICCSIWKESNKLLDYSNKYIINSIKIILNILREFSFLSKFIEIRISSSIILDVIYDHFLKKHYKDEKLEETRINTLLTISSLLNKRDYQYTINDLTKLLKEKRLLNDMPIQINELKKLIEFYHQEKSNISTKLKNPETTEEKEKRFNEEAIINSYFENVYCEENNEDLIKYKNSVSIDYTLIPENLQFYSGFFLQVCYVREKIRLPLIEGGIIDNYLYDPERNEDQLKGFAFIVYMKNIFEIKIKSIKQSGKNCRNYYLYDCLIIRTHEDIQIKLLNELSKLCKEGNLKYLIIYKPQHKDIDFDQYYSIYRMKHLISINISENKKEKTKEKKIKEIVKGGKDKKREKNKDRGKEKVKDRGKNKDKEEELSKENENDESEENMIEVNYSIETLEKSKTNKKEKLTYKDLEIIIRKEIKHIDS